MKHKRIKLYADDNVLEEFYSALVDGSANKVSRIHIPRSEVFYVRAAMEAGTGVRYSLDHVERAMYLEGMLHRRDVLDPDRKREYADDHT
tara:strand:+ start:560 stop:829 length:270 start_codon:yes stop_codon:yes gene_type:complete